EQALIGRVCEIPAQGAGLHALVAQVVDDGAYLVCVGGDTQFVGGESDVHEHGVGVQVDSFGLILVGDWNCAANGIAGADVKAFAQPYAVEDAEDIDGDQLAGGVLCGDEVVTFRVNLDGFRPGAGFTGNRELVEVLGVLFARDIVDVEQRA